MVSTSVIVNFICYASNQLLFVEKRTPDVTVHCTRYHVVHILSNAVHNVKMEKSVQNPKHFILLCARNWSGCSVHGRPTSLAARPTRDLWVLIGFELLTGQYNAEWLLVVCISHHVTWISVRGLCTSQGWAQSDGSNLKPLAVRTGRYDSCRRCFRSRSMLQNVLTNYSVQYFEVLNIIRLYETYNKREAHWKITTATQYVLYSAKRRNHFIQNAA